MGTYITTYFYRGVNYSIYPKFQQDMPVGNISSSCAYWWDLKQRKGGYFKTKVPSCYDGMIRYVHNFRSWLFRGFVGDYFTTGNIGNIITIKGISLVANIGDEILPNFVGDYCINP